MNTQTMKPSAVPVTASDNEAEVREQRKYIDEKQASAMFGMSVGWFRKKRELGDGPPYFKDGWSVRYSIRQLESWFEGRTCGSTSDYESRFTERERRRVQSRA